MTRPAVEEGLGDWLQWWRKVTPGLDLTRFRRERSGPISRKQDYLVKPYDPHKPLPFADRTADDEVLRRPLYIYSPDRTKFIDPDLYLYLSKEDGQIQADWDVDSAVALADLSRGRWMTVLFCGSPCGFDDAIWIGNDAFVVAGWWETDLPPCGDQYNPCPIAPVLWFFELSAGRVITYEGPAIPEATMAGMRGLSGGYVWRRLREKIPNLKEPD